MDNWNFPFSLAAFYRRAPFFKAVISGAYPIDGATLVVIYRCRRWSWMGAPRDIGKHTHTHTRRVQKWFRNLLAVPDTYRKLRAAHQSFNLPVKIPQTLPQHCITALTGPGCRWVVVTCRSEHVCTPRRGEIERRLRVGLIKE